MRFAVKYVVETKPGHFYYRRNGRYWGRLPGQPGSVEFAKAYAAIHVGFDRVEADYVLPGSFAALVRDYTNSAEFRGNLKPRTQSAYRYDLDVLSRTLGQHQAADIKVNHVLDIRDAYASTPGKANTLIRTMSAMYQWGMVRRGLKVNPANLKAYNVKALKIGEHRPWSPDSLAKYRAGGLPHLVLAMELAIWTGQRQGDLIKMTWADIGERVMKVVQEKTSKEVWLPISQPLATVLAAAPRAAETILVSSRGEPWARSNVLAQAIGHDLARLGIKERFHGLRKSTAVVLAEAGCSTKQISAITGQSDQMVSHYSKMADRGRLAKDAIDKLEQHISVSTASAKAQKSKA